MKNVRTSVVTIGVQLEAAFRQEGEYWLAWCLPLDVMTQAETKEAASIALKEAVELWFESCIERGVLEEALAEVGFRPIKPRDHNQASKVQVSEPTDTGANAFKNSDDFVEVLIPAYIAAKHLEPSAAR
jgi:predicted RNase H-like HicB family nuclease